MRQTTASDRDARYLRAARKGRLSVVTEYGAVRYLVDRSDRIPSYLAPAPAELTAAGWIARDGARLELTAAGSAALDAWERRRAATRAQPFGLTRSPARGELHDPGEPTRILRDRASGREIRPGEIVTDPSGHPALYAGPSMTSADGGATWRPGFNARVRYAEFGGYFYPPSALGAVYDLETVQPAAAR
ncbi:hypothetical protein [Streptomyces californicus]|uniref:hypothetical protein n=1 Tax=Streptomyces californicus TaxID=67351 RepID=UPI00296E9369|nr:hypothetical protein [Streptomyces californicus]MDW4912612.1 hypothetical protein [Streptomyces californicus]